MYYPVFLRLTAGRCVVVGGGSVAARKVGDLLAAGATVRVVAPRVGAELRRLARQGRIELVEREYQAGDLAGARLVISATDDVEVNRAVAEEARRAGAWVNVVDDPSLCDFIVPAVVRRGDLVVAVSTGGKSPALARAVRREIEELLGPEYGTALEVVHSLRRELRQARTEVTPERWQVAVALARDFLRQGVTKEDAQARVRAVLLAEED
ncbi:MAG: bifunctional precorrin-2 dehydrogenase/sirohydrochlorin ferrochelatase [Bacteroidetes bacterium]|nr:bifunctional precorrin-2 dehydrogenase/sirohydrochlorin ferrochelatase [Bacteroidota bacterium]